MKQIILIFFLCVILPLSQQAQENKKPEQSFLGEWVIDLRPTPDSDEYYQPFSVTEIKKNTFKGTFYGSPIKDGLINKNWDKLYFAFSTRDGSSEYYHSGYIEAGKLYGTSYCPNRNFVAPWVGNRE